MHNRLRALLVAVVTLAGAGTYAAVPAGAAAAPKSVTITADQDTYLSQASPTQTHGSHTWLSACPSTCDAQAAAERQALVRFPVKGLPANATGITATLKLTAARTTETSIAARKVTATWSDTVTWPSRPALGATLGTAKGLTSGEDVELDVTGAFTGAVPGDGTYSFAITATAGPQAVFNSLEGTAGAKPRLTVTYTESAASDGPLAFTKPSTAQLRASSKKVFAHYFPPFPVSIDNQAPASDYYARNWLKPEGESGKHKAYGGFLRDRPLTRSPLTGDFELADLKTEVSQAVAAGLDGFTVDILSVTSRNWTRVENLIKAAEAVDPGFKIVLMPDMNGLASVDSAALAAALAKVAASKSVYRLADNRLVVSPFKAEARTPAWWSEWMKTMKTQYGIEVAFVPCFLDFARYRDSFSSISYGFANFGHHNATANSGLVAGIDKAHSMGKIWMQPIAIQDSRPNQGIYEEAGNTDNLRLSWKGAIDGKAEWVQLVTWNDYSEGTQFAPSANAGWTWLDLSTYYLTCMKLGCPQITKDVLYVSHRVQPYAAKPTYPQTKLMELRTSPAGTQPRDTVEVLSMLTAAGTVTATIGGQTHTYAAPAGVSVKTFPLKTGSVSASASRSGAVVATATSPYEVTSTPYVQDLQYRGVSSARAK
ncbi:endo-1,3-alpha-glucanase family glycosylhydrolase [Nonomuraea sp. NPDC050786]|uniref:endo-1,3-alpha-glucanase family glycosylhydrolase n=1 Tax=Nonomuraea sp. NPDC050786 TaxID=3154840 RepID=UPI0034093A33